MTANVAIDDELLRQAVRLGKQRTKKATVNEALREYIQRRQRLKCLDRQRAQRYRWPGATGARRLSHPEGN